MPEAWIEGNTLKPKKLVGLPINVEKHGKGTVLRYDGAIGVGQAFGVRKQGFLVNFEIGGQEKVQLDYNERKFKAVDIEFVNAYVEEETQRFDKEKVELEEITRGEASTNALADPQAWSNGDSTIGKALVGRTIKVGADEKRGKVQDFKKNRYVIKFENSAELEKSQLEEEFSVLDELFIEANTAPAVISELEQWANKQLEKIAAERVEISAQLEVEKEHDLEEYMKETAKQDLLDAASAAAYLVDVQMSAYNSFCVDFGPTCSAMDPDLIESAGGVESILRETWVNMGRKDRAMHENIVRKKLGATVAVRHTCTIILQACTFVRL